MEDLINKQFKKEKRKYIRRFGRKPLDNFQIDDECFSLFGPKKFKGVHMQDSLKGSYAPGYYVLNSDLEGNEGIHWIAMVVTPKSAYIFDSFGRDTKAILPILKKNLQKQKLKIIETEKQAEQKGNSEICGHLCISWLLCCKKFGVRATAKVI